MSVDFLNVHSILVYVLYFLSLDARSLNIVDLDVLCIELRHMILIPRTDVGIAFVIRYWVRSLISRWLFEPRIGGVDFNIFLW